MKRVLAFAGRIVSCAWADIAVFCAAAILFAAASDAAFLNLDDMRYTRVCPFVKDGLTWKNAAAAFTTAGYGGVWMPLTWLSYMADISIAGRGWAFHHVVNILLHAVDAVLVFRLARAMLPRLGFPPARPASAFAAVAPFAAALLWAVNPDRAEAVVWISSRKEELWTLFSLSGVLSWLRFSRTGSRVAYASTLAFFVLSILSKPTAMAFPVLAFAAARAGAGAPQGGKSAAARRDGALSYVPLFILAAATGALAVYSQSHPDALAEVELYSEPLWWRLANAAVSAGLVAMHALVPALVYPDVRAVPGGTPLHALPALAALSVAAILFAVPFAVRRAARFRPVAAFALAWSAAAFLPVCGVFGSVGDTACAARWSYMPAVGIAVAAAALLRDAFARKAARVCAIAASVAVFVSFLAVQRRAVAAYADDASSAARTLAFDPDNWRALRTLAREYAGREGRLDEAVEMLERSLKIRPSSTTAEILCYILAQRGAKGDFARLRRIGRYAMARPSRDRSGMVLDALGIAAMREGDDRAAEIYFASSLAAPERAYSNLDTYLNLALAKANQGRRADALCDLLKLVNVRDGRIRSRAEEAVKARSSRDRPRFEWRP